MNATKENTLEERVDSVLNGAIKWENNSWKVKWNVIATLCKSEDKLCARAYDVLTKNLIKRGILSYSKEGNYDLFVMHVIPSKELLVDSNGKDLYFTTTDYADAYKRLVCPSQYGDLRIAPAE